MKIIGLFLLSLIFAPSALAQAGCDDCPLYSNVFTSSVSQWQIPSGVTSLTIEAWGGGGGGSFLSGGQGGGYFKAVLPIPTLAPTIVNSINVTVGSGGAGCSANSGNGVTGTDSVVTYSLNSTLGAVTLTAGGGSGSNFAGATGGSAGTYSTSSPKKFYFTGSTGKYGSVSKTVATTLLSAGSAATTTTAATYPMFYVSAVGGDGGDSGNSVSTHGLGGSEYVLVKGTASAFTPYTFGPVFNRGLQAYGVNAINGSVPGGGGGGAPDVSLMVYCGSGANGLVIFSW